MAAPVITLTTDFGARDPYVASMKGVLRGLCPAAMIDDLSHAIPPRDIREAALFLEAAVPHYPPGSIHIAVVDPGVGGTRRALAVRAGGQILVGPDNGVLSLAWGDEPEARALENATLFRHPVSRTFHGRDVFAPVAGHLANGLAFDAVGPPVADPAAWRIPEPVAVGGGWRGEIIHIDHYGNCVTNLPQDLARAGAVLVAGGARVPLLGIYADAAPGAALALVGSTGRIEFSVREGDAAGRYGLSRGVEVTLLNCANVE